MTAPLILASGSAIRAKILTDVGVDFDVVRPNVDESALKAAAQDRDTGLEDLAVELAEAKALAVPAPGAFVIGSDQILEHEGLAYDKPATMDEACARLKRLSGSRHTLINGVAVAQDGRIVFRSCERPALYMRLLSDRDIERYAQEAGPAILTSVGAYQVERFGGRLFERIDGDYFAVLGLALFPLLAFLRRVDALAY
ncbi:MAG: nucleoside triphosphate pyrophosphatase [Pseudomonadota bacterium]